MEATKGYIDCQMAAKDTSGYRFATVSMDSNSNSYYCIS